MKLLRTKQEVHHHLAISRINNTTVGFVPTMGALHEGHLDLIKKAKENSEVVIVSIFVNPTQFNNQKDFENYPKTLNKDLDLLDKTGVDFVFVPNNQEIYSSTPSIFIDFGSIDKILEGAFRPGHFNGVGIVVSKLLNIVKPNKTFFGQKDLQQVAIIKRLVEDLSFDTEIVIIPTVREADGLAMSSRNLRLDLGQRIIAPLIFKSLSFSKDELLAGKSWFETRENVALMFQKEPQFRLEYFELINSDRFEIIESITDRSGVAICAAAYLGEIRLIDNISIFD